jgi:hypothetical protein
VVSLPGSHNRAAYGPKDSKRRPERKRLLATVDYDIYEVVGRVKQKMKHTSPFGLEVLSRAPAIWAFILTLDSLLQTTQWSKERSETKFSGASFHDGSFLSFASFLSQVR